jgi:hypothetical protein
MNDRRRRAQWMLTGLLGAFVLLRASLWMRPNADFNIGAYNVHHLFTGALVIAAFGVPLALGGWSNRASRILALGFGAGLGTVLDEWVYLIATDGTNTSYWLPASYIGGVVVVGLAAVYTLVLLLRPERLDGIDSGGTARGSVRRDDRDDSQ